VISIKPISVGIFIFNDVEVLESNSPFGGGNYGTGYGAERVTSRFDQPAAGFTSSYDTPGWQRALPENPEEGFKAFVKELQN